jgi:hypothetical protein
MNKELYIGVITIMVAFVFMYVPVVHSQNITSDGMNLMGNTTASMNQTASELGENNTVGDVLNKTGEVGKKILGGAADVVSNISEEVKEGIGANK